MKTLFLAAVLLPACALAQTAAPPAGAQAADKQKELPKPEIDKKQDALKNDKRFDAYQQAVGKKADDLKKKIDQCKTEACFEEAGRTLELQKQSDFRSAEPSAPKAAGETDASRDAFYQAGAEKMGRAPDAVPASLEKEALALKSGSFDQAHGAGRAPLDKSLTPLSDQVLGKDHPIRDLKAGAAAADGRPIEQQAAPAAQPSVGKDSTRADVSKAQGELNAYRRKIGLGQLKQDGLYGPKTTQAVKDVQEKFGLEKTGVYDSQTKDALARRLSPDAAARDALAPGSHGPEVRELQRDLTKHGIKTNMDGVYGAQTRKALAAFQRQNGLEGTGIMDPKTRAALDAEPKGKLAKFMDEALGGKAQAAELEPAGLVKETAISRGTPNNGSLKNASHLPSEGPGFTAYRSESARYGTNKLVNGVKLMGEDALKDGRPPLQVGDMSLKSGGEIGGHASHENGKDVDIKVYGGADGFNAKQNWQLVESAINNPQFKTQYIFTSSENRAALLSVARQELGGTNSSTYIRAKNALVVWPNHEDHFHIRIY